MASYSQANRPIKVSTPLGADALLLVGFTGFEGLSTPFQWSLDLLSQDDSIAGADLLHQPVSITIKLASGGDRVLHGLVREFLQLGRHEQLVSYRMEVVPALWFLTLSSDCRIFQHLSVLDIVQKVLGENAVTDVDVRCTKSYPKREFCVQYRETHFDFVSRLLEEEGINYFFEHAAGSHTLILSDDPTSAALCPGGAAVRMASSDEPWQESDVCVAVTSGIGVYTGQVILRDYDPLQPSLNLESSAAGREKAKHYDYPGKYSDLAEGKRYAKIQAEAFGSRAQIVSGTGNCRFFLSGHKFSLEDHYRSDLNAAYHLLEVRHVAGAGDYRSWDSATLDYRNEFVAVPLATKFRPARRTARPIVHGTQTAVVVGPGGEEIFTDEYGRVKVQFYWDRQGKLNEDSSCWIRVATTWAGKEWGAIRIPRIGQEVVVDFLEGDPDRPIIVGSVYNAQQMPPFGLPANRTQSGVKSRSSLSGTPANFNEIRLEDKKGSELVFIHAEKDKDVSVEHDNSESVGHDNSVSVGNNETYRIGNNQSIGVGADQTTNVGGNRTESVGKDEGISIDGNRTESVGKDESITIGKNRTESVGKDDTVEIGQHRAVTIAKNETLKIGETRAVEIEKDDSLKVGKNFLLDVGESITIKAGDASISMKKDGTITIKGKDITLSGSGKVNVKASSDVVVKGSKVLSN